MQRKTCKNVTTTDGKVEEGKPSGLGQSNYSIYNL